MDRGAATTSLWTVARMVWSRGNQSPRQAQRLPPSDGDEPCDAFTRIRDDRDIGVVLFTGVGPAPDGGYAFVPEVIRGRGDGGYVGEDGPSRLNVLDLQRIIRSLPKVVIVGGRLRHGRRSGAACSVTSASPPTTLRLARPDPRSAALTAALVRATSRGWSPQGS